MLGLLPASPAKVERVERHLSRQRGAGVRNLATKFGFSFALSAVPTAANDHPGEPPAKRRKSVHSDTKKPAVAIEEPVAHTTRNPAETEPKKRRRFETVVEDEVIAVRAERRDSFSATAKKKQKGQPRKTEVHVGLEAGPINAGIWERRPRRRAAVSALAKVTEGFAEENAPIDKKRRDPEPEKPARTGRKRGATVAVPRHGPVDTRVEPSQELQILETIPQQQEVQHAKIPTKKKEEAWPTKRNRKYPDFLSRRMPLGETDANVPPQSPKKHDKMAYEKAAKAFSPTSPINKVVAQSVAQKRRNLELSTEIGGPPKMDSNDVEISRSTSTVSRARKPVRGAAVSSHLSRKAPVETFESELTPCPPAEQSEGLVPKVCEKVKVSPESKCVDMPVKPKKSQRSASRPAPLYQAFHLDRTAEKRSHLRQQVVPSTAGTKPRPRIEKPTDQVATSQEEEEDDDDDVDWLFDTAKKTNLRPRQARRKAPANTTLRARSPDGDLDDEMLSNIASWTR